MIDFFAWTFTPRKPTERDEIQCHECNAWSPATEWSETYVYCEACGDHDAIQCPRCDYPHDHVHCDTFNVREMQ